MWWATLGATGWCADLPVGPGELYPTLNSALNVAVAGDRVVVAAGQYVEDTDLLGVVDVEIVGAGSDPITGTVFGGGDGTSQWLIGADSTMVIRDLVLDGGPGRRALTVQGGSIVDAWNVRFRNGSNGGGAGISVEEGSTLTLHGGLVEANQSTGDAGGVRVIGGSHAVFDGGEIRGNRASGDGGGVWVGSGSDLEVRGALFAENLAQLGGGLLCDTDTVCLVEDTPFVQNAAIGDGGGVYANAAGDLTLLRTSFCENRATTHSGGGVTLFDTVATIRNTTFLDSHAGTNGGGLWVHQSALTLENNTFVGDHAGTRGAAVYQDGAAATRSVNNLFVESLADEAPFAAVDTVAGTRTGGWNLYYGNDTDVFPERLLNDWIALDPALGVSLACEAPEPADPGPAIDAGDPAILDPDGSRSDLGATGGPDARRDRDGDGTYDGPDCDDADPEQSPGRPEACDGADNNCDGVVDEGCSTPPDPRSGEPLEVGGDVGCTCASSRSGMGGSWTPSAWILAILAVGRRRSRHHGSRHSSPPVFPA